MKPTTPVQKIIEDKKEIAVRTLGSYDDMFKTESSAATTIRVIMPIKEINK